jgi:ankyrin repeat protein
VEKIGIDGLNQQLLHASMEGDEKLIRQLVTCGAEVNALDALNFVCRIGDLPTASLLVELGADVNATPDEYSTEYQLIKHTPLHTACSLAMPEIVDFLIEKGADALVKDTSGRTPMHTACGGKAEGSLPPESSIAIIEALLKAGSPLDPVDQFDMTPLHLACISSNHAGNPEVVRHLVGRGADINARDYKGRTPLHVACAVDGSITCAKLLIDLGADVNARTNSQTRNMTAAEIDKTGEIARYLRSIEMGENITRALDSQGGETPSSCTRSASGPSL